jgi:hypothetical protein
MPRQLPLAARRRPDIAPEDVGTLLLHSLRYSVGRRSTAPSTTSGLIRCYWHLTDDAHRALLIRDLHEELERAWRLGDARLLGDECDRRTWHALLAWMLAAERPASVSIAAWAEIAGLDPDMAAAVRRLL